jgi:2'-5' RNA ligase
MRRLYRGKYLSSDRMAGKFELEQYQIRLFVALDLPEAVRSNLVELMAELKPAGGARWVGPKGMHITLKFIGNIANERLSDFRAALAPIRSGAPVELQYRGVGFFPNPRRPRVLWCVVEASPNLAELAAAIERAVEPLGGARESRSFVPHVTLARLDDSNHHSLVRTADGMQERDFGAARETKFHLYESILKTGGAEYKKLETYSFVKGTRET